MISKEKFDPSRIKNLLCNYNVSQNQLSIYSGYSRSYISRCFDGIQKPSEQFIIDINRAVKELTGARTFNYKEMEFITNLVDNTGLPDNKPSSMTDREWKEFLEKLQ